jgi:zinc transporter ZupT
MGLLYAMLAGLSTILIGLLPFISSVRLSFGRYMIGFASGVVISAALLEMIPKGNMQDNAPIALVGFFTFYLLEKIAMVHTCAEGECVASGMTWVSLIGISADNFIDGLAIVAGYALDPLLGFMIFLAVIAHEIPQDAATTVVMKNSEYSTGKTLSTLGIGALLYPLGALSFGMLPEAYYEAIITFMAGEFMFIGAGELLPEAHQKYNIGVVLSVILGAGVTAILEWLMGSAH